MAHRADERGSVERDGIRVGDRVYAVGAGARRREAVLAVTRDRTGGLRREVAEREFVSNAATSCATRSPGSPARSRC